MRAAFGYIALVLFVLASTLCIINYGHWEPLDPPIASMLGVTLGMMTIGFLIARARARRRGRSVDLPFAAIIALFVGGLFFGCVTFGLLPGYNAMADDSPATTHRVKVRDYKKHKGTTYRILVDSWRPGHAEEKLFTTNDLKDAAPAYVDVVSREGALGLEYVTAVKIPVGGR